VEVSSAHYPFSFHLYYHLRRRSGSGEVYAYLPMKETNTEALLAVPPYSKVNTDHGISVGRGAWVFELGVWTTIAERVKLNDICKDNGKYYQSSG